MIKGLQILGLINDIDNQLLSKIGADVPACYYSKNCLATGIGDIINTDIDIPKYYFVLVNPKIQLSTTEMYEKIDKYIKYNRDDIKRIANFKALCPSDNSNDFEIIIRNENKQILDLLDFLSSFENSIFSRMSGSGSCCYVVFKNRIDAKKAVNIISKKYSDYWIYLAENNNINN